MPALENTFYDNDVYYIHQDGTLPPYHLDVTVFLDNTFPTQEEEVLKTTSDGLQTLPLHTFQELWVWKTLCIDKSQGT